MRRMKERFEEKAYDVIVVGGGMSGVCAAIAAARHGAQVALVHARPMLGGNASSEIRIHISGADQSLKQPDYAEGGLLYELMLANKRCNDQFSYSVWDAVLFDAAGKEKNLHVYYNTTMYDAEVEDDIITAILCVQETTEMRFRLTAPLFVDSTGNGTLGYYAGAEFRVGSEARAEFGEPGAPEEANNERMGNSILLRGKDMGKPMKFYPPSFAIPLSEKQLAKRIHCPSMKHTIDCSDIPDPEEFRRTSMTSTTGCDYGYWWMELAGSGEDIVTEYEDIRDNLLGYTYGLWDHIKNGDEGVHDHGSENFVLDWVGCLPGTRESRRLVGDYILTENDILEHRQFEDAACYGGWCVDIHTPNGLLDFDKLPSYPGFFEGVYTIPYRCYYSKNIRNMFMAGRNISTSKRALCSTRIIGTCAVGGDTHGLAAALCTKYGCLPRELADGHIHELQQLILKADGFLPNIVNEDEADLARDAVFTASSCQAGGEAGQVVNGISRKLGENWNAWVSDGISEDGEILTMTLPEKQTLSQLRLTFWSDFSYPIRVTMAPNRQRQQRIGVPAELVKDYTVRLLLDHKVVKEIEVKDNYQRLNVLDFEGVTCDSAEIVVHGTNGHRDAVIFEVRAY